MSVFLMFVVMIVVGLLVVWKMIEMMDKVFEEIFL